MYIIKSKDHLKWKVSFFSQNIWKGLLFRVSYSESKASIIHFKVLLETSRIIKNLEILSHSLLKWWQHKNISKLKILTCAFSCILDAVKLLGTTVTPLSSCHLMQIWAALLLYFFAISAIFGSSSKTGSLGFAQALSGEPSGLYALTKNAETWFWKT